MEEQENIVSVPKKQKPLIIGVVFVFLLLIGAFFLIKKQHSKTTEQQKQIAQKALVKADLINKSVQEIKNQMHLPFKIDNSTTMTDVTAEPNAIHYSYTLSGISPSKLSDTAIKKFVTSNICNNQSAKILLTSDINMNYSYAVANSPLKFLVSITRQDCNL